MLELFPARSGEQSASAQGVLLHSRYDPVREAQRFVERSLPDRPATVVLLGTGLGYLLEVLRDRCPHSRIIALSPLDAATRPRQRKADLYLPVSETDARAVVSRALRPEDVVGLELLEWEPELRAAPAAAEATRRAIRAVVSLLNADIATTAYFGARFTRNAVRNALILPSRDASEAHKIDITTKPGMSICIAAPGPTLETAASWIRRYRDHLHLWALASAARPLLFRGIDPDAFVHQDPGHYAFLHLSDPARAPHAASPLIMPLTAAVPPQPLRGRIVPFNQGMIIEEDIFRSLGCSPPRIAETGTVSATATALALSHSSMPVYIAGLDLARRDILLHSRPHVFDYVRASDESRLRPVHSKLASEAFETSTPVTVDEGIPYRSGRGMDAYATWFRALPEHVRRRLRRLGPSPVDLGIREPADGPAGRPAMGAGGTPSLPSASVPTASLPPACNAPPVPVRVAALREVLDTWRSSVKAVRRAGAPPAGTGRTAGTGPAAGAGAGAVHEAYSREDAARAYLFDAASYTSAVAAGRRGDFAARDRGLSQLAENAEELFLRLEAVVSAAAAEHRYPEGGTP